MRCIGILVVPIQFDRLDKSMTGSSDRLGCGHESSGHGKVLTQIANLAPNLLVE
jgi:hypothetical protein